MVVASENMANKLKKQLAFKDKAEPGTQPEAAQSKLDMTLEEAYPADVAKEYKHGDDKTPAQEHTQAQSKARTGTRTGP